MTLSQTAANGGAVTNLSPHQATIARHVRSRAGAIALAAALALIGQPSIAPAAAESAPAPGDLDLSFDGDGKVVTQIGSSTDQGNAVARQPDGRIVVAGFSESGTGRRFAVVRYNADGSLDTSFDGDGEVTTAIGTGSRDEGNSVALQPDGKIVVAGDSYDASGKSHFAVVRYNPDGSLDTSFDGDGKVTTTIFGDRAFARAVAVQGDGRIVVAGNSASFGSGGFVALARYNPDGSLDAGFNDEEASCNSCSANTPSGTVVTTVGFNSAADAVAIQGDGRIVVTGRTLGFNTDIVVLRYTPDGGLDRSFGPVGTTRPGTVITDIGLQTGGAASHDIATSLDLADGRIVVAGFTQSSSGTRIAVTRYLGGGALDSTFGGDGIVTTAVGPTSQGFGVAVDDAGRTIVAGDGTANGVNDDLALLRYGTDGSLDPAFGSGGIVTTPVGAAADQARGIALQPDGRIVVAGFSHGGSGIQDDFVVARYHGDSPADSTPPTIECGSADAAWHAADVSIACTASDAQSGLADSSDASFSLSTNVAAGMEEANASTNSRQVCDNAGNCATAGPIAGNIVDKKDPAVSIARPGEQTYLLNQVVSASYSCADGGSGIASCSGPVADGTSLDTSTVGPRSFTVTATDNAGNDASLTHDHRIVYPFGGFEAPVDGQPTLNTAKAGSVIPVKFTLGGDHGLGILAPGSPSSTRFDCGTAADLDEIEETDSVGSGLSYDADMGAYKYNWKTSKDWAGTCRAFDLELADGTHHQALFSFH